MKIHRVIPRCGWNIFFSGCFYFSVIASSHGGEGLWPIQSLPVEEIRKDWGFVPEAEWIQRVQRACVKITPKGEISGGGSGAFISRQGLVITNHHCVVDALVQLASLKDSNANLVRDGMYASTSAEEIECPLDIHVLDQVEDVTKRIQNELKGSFKRADFNQLQRHVRAQRVKGLTKDLISSFGGLRYEIYTYKIYSAKLVFVPENALGNFGGEDDNFRYPRHNLDIAILRAYRDGTPVETPDCFPLSTAGVKEDDSIFVAGHPGKTKRRMTVAYLAYLRDYELLLKATLSTQTFQALTAYSQIGEDQQKRALSTLKHESNMSKIYSSSLEYLKDPKVLEEHKKQEQFWRTEFAALKIRGDPYLKALDQIEADCETMRKSAAIRELGSLHSKLSGLITSLGTYSKACQNSPDNPKMLESFCEFLDHIFDTPLDLEVEKVVLTSWISTLVKQQPADSPLLKMILAGKTPEEAVTFYLQKLDLLANKAAVVDLLEKNAEKLNEAKIPMMKLLKELAEARRAQDAEFKVAYDDFQQNIDLLERGLKEIYGDKLAPEASFTLRLGWGKVSGIPQGATSIPWATTFASMTELATAKANKDPYTLSKKFVAEKQSVNLTTPFNFVSSIDGAPGSSGAPVFSKDAKLVGVLFDGNEQAAASVYGYILPELGARSIAVHCDAIWESLKHIYKTENLLKELQTANESPSK